MSGNWRFDTLDEAGNVTESRVRPVAMRQTYKQELLYLLELCGYEVLAVYGDYACSPAGNEGFVWVVGVCA